ncbi:hypothetical protein SAMN05216403_11538 [Nitrosospira multiformis ATCC 25196]|uniref:Uncharacterized protein n=1 Tax=Nitrosospira multiformis (strain ATCC 25196 / NCIMB 11849 / C 71) TaxID=323848 RepID=A0A1H5VYR3_NITMU|nr:hypothetical protein [Nitrosospira multiformis]SEF92168.1 hypothetical protein SAMN05216403_11538 [Nitrosospira multiformis ATCC 25196]
MSSRSKRHRARPQASCAGLFLQLYDLIIPFEMADMRVKIIIVALVIGLVWGGGDSDKAGSKESTSPFFITAYLKSSK